MLLGYNTNGFGFHRLEDAIDIIADLGYECVAITLDHYALSPYDENIDRLVDTVREQLSRRSLCSVIETGARFLLDSRRKHFPTLLDRREVGRDQRLEFLLRATKIAGQLGAKAVSFWSGVLPDGQSEDAAWELLIPACRELSDFAAEQGTVLAFEPEPGMFIDTVAKYDRLAKGVEHECFRLTIDIGHLQCNEDEPPGELISRHLPRLANVHLDDMRRGIHDHLFFGEGDVQFEPVMAALAKFRGPACIELSRHSHDAVETARRAKGFFDDLME
jgi:L-ribulose-5-phosphate 3-epimerase